MLRRKKGPPIKTCGIRLETPPKALWKVSSPKGRRRTSFGSCSTILDRMSRIKHIVKKIVENQMV